jgi:hypothetical protein
MSKHTKFVEGFQGSLDDLAKSIGNMTHDQTAVFIEKLADDIKRQADNDLAKGRKQLANKLYQTSNELYKAKVEMDSAWKICEPYMK